MQIVEQVSLAVFSQACRFIFIVLNPNWQQLPCKWCKLQILHLIFTSLSVASPLVKEHLENSPPQSNKRWATNKQRLSALSSQLSITNNHGNDYKVVLHKSNNWSAFYWLISVCIVISLYYAISESECYSYLISYLLRFLKVLKKPRKCIKMKNEKEGKRKEMKWELNDKQ